MGPSMAKFVAWTVCNGRNARVFNHEDKWALIKSTCAILHLGSNLN